MDQKIRSSGGYVVAALLFFCAFIFTVLGLSMVLSYPHGIWKLGSILVCCGIVVGYNGFTNIRSSKRLAKEEKEEMDIVNKVLLKERIETTTTKMVEASKSVRKRSAIQILAHWTYHNNEWNNFIPQEKRQRIGATTGEVVILAILGMIYLLNIKEESWLISIYVTAGVCFVYWIGKYFLSTIFLSKSPKGDVVITNKSVIINGVMNSFQDELYWLVNVEVNTEATVPVLAITYGWKTRNSISEEVIRVPVPEGKLQEAKEVQQTLLNSVKKVQECDATEV